MTHASDATKAWVKAIPKTNSDGNVIEWRCEYKYTLNDFSHTFDNKIRIEIPSKAPSGYTQAELLTLLDKPHWDDMFNKKYGVSIASAPVETTDNSFDVSSLSES